jgi:aryl-alcohol dehydrogenase-like predicted oxidoreductase
MNENASLRRPLRGEPTGASTRVILGGRFGEETVRSSWQRLDRFVERGGEAVDTAHSYAEGRSEQVIGDWLRANPGSLVVVDKVGHPDGSGSVNLSARALRREIAESHRRLGVATIDVVLLHRDSPAHPVEEIAETLAAVVAEGEAREIGVSNWLAPRLCGLVAALAVRGHVPLISYQYSLAVPLTELWPGARHADESVRRVAAEHKLTVLAWAAQARGFFAGRSEPPAPGRPDPFDGSVNRARRTRCRELARDLGTLPETVALAWLLHQARIRPIIGPRSVAEVDASMDAAQIRLDAAVLDWLAEGAR